MTSQNLTPDPSGPAPGFSAARRNLVRGGAMLGLGALAVGAASQPGHADEPTDPMQGVAVNVKDFGAKGDGTTLDGTAFQQAMAAVGKAGGGLFLVPPGTYVIDQVTTLVDNVHIYSPGATLVPDRAGRNFFAAVSGTEQGYGSGVRNVKAEGLTFHGDFANKLAGCGFALHHAEDVVIERCNFIENQLVGHQLDLCGCNRITVRDCTFSGFYNINGDQTYRVEAIELDQSRVGSPSYKDNSASYDQLMTQNLWIENCQFLPLTVNGTTYPCPNPLGAHAVAEDHYYDNITFIGNLIVDPSIDIATVDREEENHRLYGWKGVTHFPTTRNLRIEGNTFIQHHERPNRAISVFSETWAGMASVPPSQPSVYGTVPPLISENITITGNQFIGFGPGAEKTARETIWLEGVENAPVRNVTISGNVFSDGASASGAGTFAISATHAENVTITDNKITNYADGIRLARTNRFHITDNIVTTDSRHAADGVQVTDRSAQGFVTTNIVDGFRTPYDHKGCGPHVKAD